MTDPIPVVRVIREPVRCPRCRGSGQDRVRCYGRGRGVGGARGRVRYYACQVCTEGDEPLRWRVEICSAPLNEAVAPGDGAGQH